MSEKKHLSCTLKKKTRLKTTPCILARDLCFRHGRCVDASDLCCEHCTSERRLEGLEKVGSGTVGGALAKLQITGWFLLGYGRYIYIYLSLLFLINTFGGLLLGKYSLSQFIVECLIRRKSKMGCWKAPWLVGWCSQRTKPPWLGQGDVELPCLMTAFWASWFVTWNPTG